MINPDLGSQNANVGVTMNISNPGLIKEVVIGLKKVGSESFYDWGLATASNSKATWSRAPQMPLVNPAPICTDGVSSKVLWEVKYSIRLNDGSESFGVLPTKLARIFTGAYCPSGLVAVFGTSTSTGDGFTAQVANYDPTFQWAVSAAAIRPELTLSGLATATINSSGFITVSGLKPGISAGVLVTTTKSGYPTKSSAASGQSLP